MEKEKIPTVNVFLIDWLTFVVRDSSVEEVISLVGFDRDGIAWEPLGGCNGYPHSVFFSGVRIMYGATDDMGICCNMSGQGCRTFESYGLGNWLSLFERLEVITQRVHYTRLDLAFDDHTGVLDIQRLRQDTEDGYLTARVRTIDIHKQQDADGTLKGLSLYYGSPRSNIRCRIYDKALERGFDDLHWIRVEMQLRDNNAASAIGYLLSDLEMSAVFVGVIRNYIQFREYVPTDSNKARWPIADYWAAFLDDAAPLTLWVNPGVDYNLENLDNFVIRTAGNALHAWIYIHGLAKLVAELERCKPLDMAPTKYKRLRLLASQPGGGIVYDETDS